MSAQPFFRHWEKGSGSILSSFSSKPVALGIHYQGVERVTAGMVLVPGNRLAEHIRSTEAPVALLYMSCQTV